MRPTYRWPAIAAVAALAACGSESEGPTALDPQFAFGNAATLTICKTDFYSAFPAQTPPDDYVSTLGTTFNFEVNGSGGYSAVSSAFQFPPIAGCFDYATTQGAVVEITEILPEGTDLVRVSAYNPYTSGVPFVRFGQGFESIDTSVDGERTINLTMPVVDPSGAPGRTYAYFKNVGFEVPDEETGMEGCTPGYWGRDQHFDSWVGYSTTDLVSDVFGLDPADMDYAGAWTLLDALNQNGNGNSIGQMLRHATAALLNASSSVEYPYTSAQIIADVQAAVDSGVYQATKNKFAAANELGCTLN